MRVTTNNIIAVMESLINANVGKRISWKMISAAMTDAGMVVKNWMTVRAVLQGAINMGLLERTADLRVEEYEVRKGL